jgi:hypothetical protein
MNSRDAFVKQVAQAIADAQKDTARTESFIFGLSAKWGEGKTTFIENLLDRLGDGWVRVDVNPWKFSDNKITFLQAFLIELISKSDGCKTKKEDILQTKNETSLTWNKKAASLWVSVAVYLVLTALIALFASIKLENGADFLPGGVATILQAGITFVLGTVLIPLLSRTATATVSDRATTTLIEFNEKFKEIVDSYGDKRLLIVVDDLDRVSAKSAITVLDNLRTFFDQKKLCFIVSGDHSVMERHIGNELLQKGNIEEQLEEGRRYLKKIFNIYWRLPIPTDAEITSYIAETMESNLSVLGLTDAENNQLATLLNELFENNYRNIERMVSQIAFTLQIVKGKLDSCRDDDETRIYYEDLLRHKMLLVKVLLIQELANPYYEYLLSESDSLRISDMRQGIFSSKNDSLDVISNSSMLLAENQWRNLRTLIKAEPKFHNDNGLVVYDMKPFIFLSADANFGDHRGLLPSEFHKRLSESIHDSSVFEKLLEQHSIELLQKGIEAMVAERKSAMEKSTSATHSQPLPTVEMAQEMIAILDKLNNLNEFDIQKQKFRAYFAPEVITLFAGLNSSEYAKMVFALGDLYRGDTDYEKDMVACIGKITTQQFLSLIQFAEDKEINSLYENILWSSFKNLAVQNLNSLITQFESIVDKLGECPLQDDILTALVARIKNNYTDVSAKTAAKVIMKSGNAQYIGDAISKVRALLPYRQPFLLEILRILDADNHESYVLSFVEDASTYQELCMRIQFVAANSIDADAVWQHVIEAKLDMLIDNIARPAPSPQPPNPSAAQAKLLAQKVIRYAKENSQNPLLTNINQTVFLFTNLDSIQGDQVVTKYLKKLKESGDETNSNNAKRLLNIGEQGNSKWAN